MNPTITEILERNIDPVLIKSLLAAGKTQKIYSKTAKFLLPLLQLRKNLVTSVCPPIILNRQVEKTYCFQQQIIRKVLFENTILLKNKSEIIIA